MTSCLRFFAYAVFAILAVGCAQETSQAETEAAEQAIEAETLASGLLFPWSMAFTPEGEMLIVEKAGGIRLYRDGALASEPLAGAPENIYVNIDSGRHDIALDPDFADNRRVFLAFAEGDEDANHVAVWRGRYENRRFSDGEIIFRTQPDKAGPSHPGGRLLFLPDKTMLLSVGDGYDYADAAQDLSSHLGKVLRLDRDGAPPADNPFIGQDGAAAEIFSYGHRNIQGLALDPATGEVWAHEHGPRGGDEINLLKAGANYGWPLATNGIDYDGTLVSERAHAPGVQSPLIVWAPSIAPSGLAIYRGDVFPDMDGQFLLGGLAARAVICARRDNEGRSIAETGRLLTDADARIRDVRTGPDGNVYILTDEADGKLLRLRRK